MLVWGNGSMASNSALEAGNSAYVDNVGTDSLSVVGLVGLRYGDLRWLWNAEFEDHV